MFLLSVSRQVALMVAAEFWEQGDLERSVLDQQPIVRFIPPSFSSFHIFLFFRFLSLAFILKLSPLSPSANDGQKLCRTVTQDAVWFHRLRMLICVQGNIQQRSEHHYYTQ